MVPRDSFIFPDIKMLLKENRFQDTEEIKREDDGAVGYGKQSVSSKSAPKKWKNCRNKCVVPEGDWNCNTLGSKSASEKWKDCRNKCVVPEGDWNCITLG
jgi:hypothetical protein